MLGLAASAFCPAIGIGLSLLGGGGGKGGQSSGGGGIGKIIGAVGSLLGGGGSGGGFPGQMGGYPKQYPNNQQGQNGNYGHGPGAQAPAQPPPVITDRACDIATQLAPFLNSFYEALGGQAGAIDWSKFDNPESIGWLRGNAAGHRGSTDLTGSEPSQRVVKACDAALWVGVA